MSMKEKKKSYIYIILEILLVVSLYLPWFGGDRFLQEIRGVDLSYTIGYFYVLIIVSCLGIFSTSETTRKISIGALIGFLILQIYKFFTWHYLTITGYISLFVSFDLTYPEFYISLFICIVNIIVRIKEINIWGSDDNNKSCF